MTESSGKVVEFPSESSQDALTAIRRDGARQLLTRAIVEEVAEYVDARKPCQDEHGRQLVVRNGHLPPRTIQTPLGEIPAQAAAGARPAVRGRPREVHVVNSAAVPAEDELVGRAVSLALPQGHQHRGISARRCRLCWDPTRAVTHNIWRYLAVQSAVAPGLRRPASAGFAEATPTTAVTVRSRSSYGL